MLSKAFGKSLKCLSASLAIYGRARQTATEKLRHTIAKRWRMDGTLARMRSYALNCLSTPHETGVNSPILHKWHSNDWKNTDSFLRWCHCYLLQLLEQKTSTRKHTKTPQQNTNSFQSLNNENKWSQNGIYALQNDRQKRNNSTFSH